MKPKNTRFHTTCWDFRSCILIMSAYTGRGVASDISGGVIDFMGVTYRGAKTFNPIAYSKYRCTNCRTAYVFKNAYT